MGVNNNLIIPWAGVEFIPDRSNIGPSVMPFTALLIGQKTNAEMSANVPYTVTSANEAGLKAGFGSQLHLLAITFFATNKYTPVKIIGVLDAATATASTSVVTISGTATASGEQALYIDGTRVSVSVAYGEAGSTIAPALEAAINAISSRVGMTPSSATNVLTLTSKSKGIDAGKTDVRSSYYSSDVAIPGLTISIVNNAGTVNPDITDTIAAMKDDWYNVIVMPWSDDANLQLLESELASRLTPERQIDGVAYVGVSDSRDNTITKATDSNRNSPSMVLVDAYRYLLNPIRVACAVASLVSESIQKDPGVPLHRLILSNVLPPPELERRTYTDLNLMTQNGIMTLDPNTFGGPSTLGTVTMYLKDSTGADDNYYQYQNRMFILMYLRYDFVYRIKIKFDRARLAKTATGMRSDIQIITEDIGKAEAIVIGKDWYFNGLIEDIDSFIASVSCTRDQSNPNRLNWGLSTDIIDQLITASADLKFYPQARSN